MDLNFDINAIPMLSTMKAQNDLMTAVGTKMLSSEFDTLSSGVAELTKAMELSVNPNLGSNFDVSI